MRAEKTVFTPEMDAMLIKLYPNTPNNEIFKLTGWGEHILKYNCKRLGLKKTRECKARTAGQTVWTEEMIQFTKDNFYKITNQELANALGLRLTVVRNMTRRLGLQHYALEYWTDEQAAFVKANYRTMGDTIIAEKLQELYPREKKWTRKHVHKKRLYMDLHRTRKELQVIVSEHSQPGGRSHTIKQNSASTNLPDKYVANFITRDPELKEELLKHPDLLDLKRQQIRLSRVIKEVNNGA